MLAIRACAGDCDVEKLAQTIQQQEEKCDKIVADRCTGSGASLISCGNTLTGLQESMSMISSALGMAKAAEERALLMQVYQRQVADINQTLDAMQSLGASASTLEQFTNGLAQTVPELMVGVGSTGKISLNSRQIGSNEKYQPNAGAVGNMKEFFNSPGFGQDLASASQRTHKIVQGETVYKANVPIGNYIKAGDQFYLDKTHKNHIEVFGSNNKVKAVLNLDGSRNEVKTIAARAQGRTIPK